MKQTDSPDNGKDALKRKDDDHLTHDRATFKWLTRNWRAMALIGGLSTIGGSGFALFLWLANVIDDLGLALNFTVQSTFSLFLFLAVIVQAVISNKQWRAAHDGLDRTDKMIENMQGQLASLVNQEKAMQDQTKLMADALVIGNKAYVDIHSPEAELKQERLILLIENTGNIPAKDVKVDGTVSALIMDIAAGEGSMLRRLRPDIASCRFRKEFSRLFRGNLKGANGHRLGSDCGAWRTLSFWHR